MKVQNLATNARYRFVLRICVGLMCFSSQLFNTTKTSAQTADNANLSQTTVVNIADAVSVLIKVLQSENVEARVNAARALSGMGTQAKLAEPALTVALYDKEPLVSYNAAIAIANLGGDTKVAFPKLLEALQHESKWIRNDAVYALSNLALRTQTKALRLSAKELDKAINEFEKILKVVEKSKFEIPLQAVKSINNSLDFLNREKQREQSNTISY